MSRQAMREGRIAAVVGLGNPGAQYERTRHNVGFLVVDRLADQFRIGFQDRKFKASWGTGLFEGEKIVLLKPLTYMNRSGEAVGEIARYFGFDPAQILVVHDDLDLAVGRIRIVRGGGAGGHRGVGSIIEHLGSGDFPRLKLGIGRPAHREPIETFVLQPPYAHDASIFQDMIVEGAEAAVGVLSLGTSAAMNRFNRKEASKSSSGSSEKPEAKTGQKQEDGGR